MNRNRSIAAALALALASFGLVATMSSPTVANPAFHLSGQVRIQERPHRGNAWVQGVITDGATGRALDNIEAQAFPADDTSGAPAATSLTYESPDGSTSHGFYRLYGLAPGDYQLRFLSLDGRYVKASASVTVGNRQIAKLDIEMKRAMTSTTTSASLRSSQITTLDRGRVVVTVAGGPRGATGDVEVRDGRRVLGSDTLGPGDSGTVTVSLHRLDTGTYSVRAYFLGSRSLKPSSTAKAMTLRVTRPRHHHRPNAW